MLATDVASLERVLRSAYGGDDELGEGSAEPTSRRVARLHSLQGEGRPEILVYDVSAPSPPLDVRYLVIAIRTARGYLVFEKSLGEQGVTPSWDEDDTVLTLTVTPSWIGSVLRLDARVEVRTTRFVQDESCQERIEELTTTSYAIVCRVERDPRCYALTTGFDTNGGTTWSSCNDEEDGERTNGDPVHASARLTIDDQGVAISGVRGDADALDVEVGAWSWEALPDVMHQPEWQLDE